MVQYYHLFVVFFHNSLTRRTIVQSIYSNHFVFSDDVNFFLNEEEFLAVNIKNSELYILVMEKVFVLWDQYEQFFNILDLEFDLKSLIALSVLKAFIAELLLKLTDSKILLKEYLVLLNSFSPMEVSDIKVCMNKCLELDFSAFEKS